ncbi:hypothetical protein DFH11DRAFT_1501002 [Phellopilus nigrolimitatus]|nr:hypothetical protein DFH11DRAFT_1501002 [Phellopilus nigrolimitatus]
MALPASKNIFVLTKYSRAVFKQPDGNQNSQASKDCDWHHHTQPNLRLLLESRRCNQGGPESIRLREDIDLLVIRKHVHPFPTQGLPLKAVYRESMVGIRYLPTQARSSAPSEFQRFQMTFQTPQAAAALIEAIRDACPCKPSPVNTAAVAGPSIPNQTRGNDTISGSQSIQCSFPQIQSHNIIQTPARNCFNSSVMPTPQYSDDHLLPASQATQHFDLPPEFSTLSQPAYMNHAAPRLESRTSNYCVSVPQARTRHQTLSHEIVRTDHLSSPNPARQSYSSLPRRHTATIFESDMRCVQEPRIEPRLSHDLLLPTPPSSSQAPTTGNSEKEPRTSLCKEHPTVPVTNQNDPSTSTASTKDPMLTSLYEACKLDDLPQEELEQLVAHIVREDGFAQLLEKLDQLWQIKGYVNTI